MKFVQGSNISTTLSDKWKLLGYNGALAV